MASKTMEKRSKNKQPERFGQSHHAQIQVKSQSRISDYIQGRLSLDQMVNKDRIIKPEERHNKRAFLPHINDEMKIVPPKIVKPKTIEAKVPPAPMQRIKTKIKEYDPTTNSYRTPTPSTQPKQKKVINIDLNDYCFVINKEGSKNQTAAIEFKPHDKSPGNSTSTIGSQMPTPYSQSPCNEMIPVISNVNLITPPDKVYYEETLGTKNDEISMLKEKIRNLQKNLIAKNNYFGVDEENVINKIVESLEIIATIAKNLKNTNDQCKISDYLSTIEDQQEKWYSYVATISEGMKHLKESNASLKQENVIKETQLQEEHEENERLQKQLISLKTENTSLITEKNHFVDSLSSVKHSLKLAEKENEALREQAEHHKRLNGKAIEQLNMLNEACKKVQIELQDKEKASVEVGAKLRHEIKVLEAANEDLSFKYEHVCNEVNRLNELYQENTALAEEVKLRHQNEIETAVNAKRQYIETLEKEAQRLKDEIHSLEVSMREVSRKNEQNYLLISQLTNENHTLREDTKYMNCEKEQLNEAISEWCKNESLHDSVHFIDMIDNLKMKMVIAETNYSNRLMENLEQTVKFTRLMDGQLDS